MAAGSAMTDLGSATNLARPLPTAGVSGERRVLTVLFCDMVNSTAIAEQLDPEDWTEIVHGAFEQLTPCILRYEGTVVKLLGDAVLAFFGTPVAHEDDPQRAVLAALDMLNAMRVYQEQVKKQYAIDLNVRIGINTGPVVVATIGSPQAMEHTALGDAVNVAARMEQTAAPGTIQISGDTYRRVAPLFEVESLGEVEVKGKSKPIAAYRVLKAKPSPGSLRGVDGISAPLIGRHREMDLLKDAVARLQEGRGQIICLFGEAGLGKSRLISELRDFWKETDPKLDHWAEMAGVPYDASRPFGLFQNYARKFMGIELDDPKEIIHEKVVATIRAHGGNDDVVALCSVAFRTGDGGQGAARRAEAVSRRKDQAGHLRPDVSWLPGELPDCDDRCGRGPALGRRRIGRPAAPSDAAGRRSAGAVPFRGAPGTPIAIVEAEATSRNRLPAPLHRDRAAPAQR
jgi:class 3 adenylate cyclase